MTLRSIREPSVAGGTLGALYVNGVWRCWQLEDEIREIPGVPVSEWKIPGRTAIPAGRYRVRLTFSPRFNRVLPELLHVPGFSAIRIHVGNRPEDTEGCVLVGLRRAGSAVVADSTRALAPLLEELGAAQARDEEIWHVIENPYVGA